jgi:hypothetical protein
MNANTILDRVRDLAQAKLLELRPFAGEEMSLPLTNPQRDGFIAGERALATQILELTDGTLEDLHDHAVAGPVEEEMVMSLGRT